MAKPATFNPAQFEANMAALPELAYAIHLMDGAAILIKRGETGFYPVDTDKFPNAASDPEGFVAQMNGAMGVRPSEIKAMEMGSIFRWDAPGAHPEAYKLLDFYADLEAVHPEAGKVMADRARAMAKAGADYDAIVAHFKEVFDDATKLREADGVPV